MDIKTESSQLPANENSFIFKTTKRICESPTLFSNDEEYNELRSILLEECGDEIHMFSRTVGTAGIIRYKFEMLLVSIFAVYDKRGVGTDLETMVSQLYDIAGDELKKTLNDACINCITLVIKQHMDLAKHEGNPSSMLSKPVDIVDIMLRTVLPRLDDNKYISESICKEINVPAYGHEAIFSVYRAMCVPPGIEHIENRLKTIERSNAILPTILKYDIDISTLETIVKSWFAKSGSQIFDSLSPDKAILFF